LTRRTRKEKEQRTTPGGEQAPVLHPQQHDTPGVLILILDIPFLVERYIAIPVPSQIAGVYLNLYMAKGDRQPLQSHWYINGRRRSTTVLKQKQFLTNPLSIGHPLACREPSTLRERSQGEGGARG
jgi:hypothetical protein